MRSLAALTCRDPVVVQCIRIGGGLDLAAGAPTAGLELPAGAPGGGLGGGPEQATATPQASRAVNSLLIGSHTDARCGTRIVVMSLAMSSRPTTLSE